MGCILGVGMGGFPFMEKNITTLKIKVTEELVLFLSPLMIPNMASGFSIRLNLRGINFTVSSACASAGHALSTAAIESVRKARPGHFRWL